MTMMKVAALAAAGALLGAGTAHAAAPTLYDQALALERQGRILPALELLDGLDLKGARAAHRAHVRTVARALGAASMLVREREFDLAQTTLAAAEKDLAPTSELALVTALRRREAQVARVSRASADVEADAALAKAKKLADDGRHDDAAAIYKAVADEPAEAVSPELRSKARVAELQEEADAATARDPWYDGPRDAVVKALTWILYLLAALAVLALLRGIHAVLRRLGPRKGTTLSVEDLDASPTERPAKSYVLARQLLAEIRGAGLPASTDGLDEARDLDGSTLSAPLPRVADEGLARYAAFVQDDTPIKLGPFSVSPRQIVYLVAPFLRRTAETELRGALVSDGTHVSLTVERFDKGEAVPTKTWHTVCDGESAHAKTLAEMAARLAGDAGTSEISRNWQSLLLFRQAMADLESVPDAEDRRDALDAIRERLRRSLDHDQGNLLARFHLARVERLLGENSTAAEHFGFLDALVRNADLRSGAIGTFVERHPEMRYIARYNRAVALSKMEDWDCHNEAVSLLQLLGMELSGDETLADAERLRLQMLTASAWADSLVFELDALRRKAREDAGAVDERTRRRRDSLIALIREIRTWLDEEAEHSGVREDRAWVRSYATVQNAYGRALYFADKLDDAIAAFETAIALAPELADAHVNFASALVRKKPKRWQRRAESVLRHALHLAPDNEHALFLLGRVLTDPAIGKVDEARELLGRVTDNPWAAFLIAEIDADEGKFLEAARGAERSARMRRAPDIRSVKLIEWTLTAGASGGVDPGVVEAALVAAQNLERSSDERLREIGKSKRPSLLALRARPKSPPPGASDDDAPAAEQGGGANDEVAAVGLEPTTRGL